MDFNKEDLLEDFGLESNDENLYTLYLNINQLKDEHALYNFHLNHPHLHYAEWVKGGCYPITHLEPPPRVLERLKTSEEIFSWRYKYFNLITTVTDFSKFNPEDFLSIDYRDNLGIIRRAPFESLSMLHGKLWYTCNGISSPVSWIFRHYNKKAIRDYYDYYDHCLNGG